MNQAAVLQKVLGLESSPVAVKFVTQPGELDGLRPAEKSRYCQPLAKAQ
jgi:uncharacterized protein (DUF169 family)